MITFITGVPGSGKSYKAVYSIYNNFSSSKNAKKDIKKDFLNCYTNINQFKFKSLENVFLLDIDHLKQNLSVLHDLYKQKESDETLIEKCKEFHIYKSLFVIDEAHNIFDTNNPVLIWWLSYHRHLYHDIYLITQNLSLIHTKYKSFSEYFYKAKPTTLSLSGKTFKYDVFINARMSMTSKSHTEKLIKIDEVFSLYHSGDSVSTTNILLKFYIFSFIMLLIFGSLIYYLFFSSSNFSNNQATVNTSHTSTPIIQNVHIAPPTNKIDTLDYTDKKFLTLTCNKHYCTNGTIKIDFLVLNHFIKSNEITVINTAPITHIFHKYNIYMSNDLFNFLQGGNNEKSINAVPDISNIIGR